MVLNSHIKKHKDSTGVVSMKKNLFSINLDSLLYFGFFIYLSAYLGNKQGTGTVDAIILRLSFVVFICCFILKWLVETSEAKLQYKNSKGSKFYFGSFSWFLLFTLYGFSSAIWALNPSKVFVSCLTSIMVFPPVPGLPKVDGTGFAAAHSPVHPPGNGIWPPDR